jgi:hypothetical protein
MMPVTPSTESTKALQKADRQECCKQHQTGTEQPGDEFVHSGPRNAQSI